MLVIKNKELIQNIFNEENIIFKETKARPSKSLVDTGFYREYENIDNIFIHDLKEFVIREMICYFFRYKLKSVEINDSVILANDLQIHYNITGTLAEIIILISALKAGDYFLYKIEDLFRYPHLEYVYCICYLFKKCYIFNSKFTENVYIICCEYKIESNILSFLKKIDKKYIRFLGLNIPLNIQKDVYHFNNKILLMKINKYNFLTSELSLSKTKSIDYEKQYIYNYYKKYLNITEYNENCCNNIEKCMHFDCKICLNCYSLFYDDDFSAFHAAAAEEKANL
tara:strand:+ start:172 stop:1020 length:849 start_codon:yes stop_codon:yes gene_type:complete